MHDGRHLVHLTIQQFVLGRLRLVSLLGGRVAFSRLDSIHFSEIVRDLEWLRVG